jgi:hypothetical protein
VAAHEAHEKLLAADLEATVEPLRMTYEIPLRSQSDAPGVRRSVAKAVLEALGDVALSDEVEITLNGTSLSPEILDDALAPTLVYKV